MAVFGGCLGFAFAFANRLVYEAYDCQGTGLGCVNDGRVAAQAHAGGYGSLRPR